MNNDDKFIKVIQLMNKLRITFSLFSYLYKEPEIIITIDHLYDVLIKYNKFSLLETINSESLNHCKIEKIENCLLQTNKYKFDKAAELLKLLNISFMPIVSYPGGIISHGTVSAYDLYDILMNEEKLKVLVAKLNNKAFW